MSINADLECPAAGEVACKPISTLLEEAVRLTVFLPLWTLTGLDRCGAALKAATLCWEASCKTLSNVTVTSNSTDSIPVITVTTHSSK